MRKSPGGAMPSSSRSTPEDPPSSATGTTAVTLRLSCREAPSAAERPWPPPMQTMRGSVMNVRSVPSAPLDIPVLHGDIESVLAEHRCDPFADHDRPVVTSGASHADREIPLALRQIPGDEHVEEIVEPVHELVGLRLLHHV